MSCSVRPVLSCLAVVLCYPAVVLFILHTHNPNNQFLEHELKQSYTTKNFTLKSGLLELEKQYRYRQLAVRWQYKVFA